MFNYYSYVEVINDIIISCIIMDTIVMLSVLCYSCDLHAITYLTGRKQCIRLNSKISTPFMCDIFFNDLHMTGNLDDLSLFADNATESVSSPLIKNIEISLQNCANSLINWCKANRMVPSVEKAKVKVIASSKRLRNLKKHERNLNIYLDENNLEQVTHEKLLGCVIDENLTWESHIKKCDRKYFLNFQY